MKRFLVNVLFFIFLLFAADYVRASLVSHILAFQLAAFNTGAWLASSNHVVILWTCVYAGVYAAVGLLAGWHVNRPMFGIGLAALLGMTTPIVTLFFHGPQPMAFSAHGAWWYDFLGWANWDGPPTAAIGGAFAWYAAVSSRSTCAAKPR
jgi:hypothetical protein